MGIQWRIELLGGLRAVRGEQIVTRFQTQQTGLLLAYMAYYRQRSHPREALIELLWPGCEPHAGRHRLSMALSALRAQLEPEGVPAGSVIVADRASVRLNPAAIVTDVTEFRLALRSAQRGGSDEERAWWLGQAVARYRGALLPDTIEDWVLQERQWLAELYFQALDQWIAHLERAGQLQRALEAAQRGVRADPLREETYGHLMRLYAAGGQPTAALRQFQELERLLEEQLETTPSPSTRALAREIARVAVLRPQVPATPWGSVPESAAPSGASLAPGAGENRLVTLLFADMSRSVETTRDLHPEDAADLVNRLLGVMVDAVLKYEGRVDRFLGDGVLAVFGVQQAHEDDPERAIRAALEIREAARKLGREVTVGINTGEVYLGAVGTERHQERTVVGPAVNLASRLQEHAEPGQILVGEATYRQTRRAFTFSIRSLALKGYAEPIAAYAVEQALPRPEKVRGLDDLFAPLIGRDQELAQLRQVLVDLRQGRGHMVSLIGEAGIGKSRLVAELKAESGPGEGLTVLWLEGRCLELGMTASYSLFVDLFRELFGWRSEDDDRQRVTRIGAALRELADRGYLSAERAEEMGPLIGNLLSLRSGSDWDVRLKNASPEQIRHQTLLAVRDFFLALAQRQPVILVMEDLHWADGLSLDTLSLLVETVTQAPLALLCVYRPEREHRSWRLGSIASQKCLGRYTELYLRELSPEESLQLVASLLSVEDLPDALKELILEKSRGNPFYVEEVVRSLIDRGLLYRDGAVWRARAEVETVAVPESVQSVILSRIDRLRPDLKQLLQSASVIGRLFRRRVLERTVAGAGPLETALWELEEQALIYQERVVPEEEYSFKHVLTQETIYGSILKRQRVVHHQQVAEAIEALYQEGLDGYYEELAYHYERSSDDDKAVEYLLKAGEKARRAYLNEEAIGYFQRALARLASLGDGETGRRGDGAKTQDPPSRFVAPSHPPSDPVAERRLEALKGLGQVYQGISKAVEAADCFRQAIAVGQEIGLAPRALVRLYFWLADALWWQSQFDQVIRIGETGLALLGEAGEPRLGAEGDSGGGRAPGESLEAALMNHHMAIGYGCKGDREKNQEFVHRNAQFVRRLPYSEELRPVYASIAQAYCDDKNLEEAAKWFQALAEQAEQHHDLRALAAVNFYTGNILSMSGDLRGAISRRDQARGLYNKIGDASHGSWCLLYAGWDFLSLGDLRRAEEYVCGARSILERMGMKRDVALSDAAMGTLSLCRGCDREAADAFRNASQLYQEAGSPGHDWAILCLARAHLAQGERLEALREFQQAIGLVETDPLALAAALSGLEEAYEDPAAFRVFCRRFQEEHPGIGGSLFGHWFLRPTETLAFDHEVVHDEFLASLSSDWVWQDPFGDGECCVAQNGLEIRAANGRDLWHLNLSAPRLLRGVAGECAVQTVCAPISAGKPAIGGIVLWKDRQNFLRLDRGVGGPCEISFSGCLEDRDLVLGRGGLGSGPRRCPLRGQDAAPPSSERLFLRLERRGGRVNALCSADGRAWFSVGEAAFPADGTVEVGLHAIGAIDRALYPGAYPEGTAIRFESFRLMR